MTDTPERPKRLLYATQQRPDFGAAFKAYFGTTYRPENAVLQQRERVLVYLAIMASLGAVDGFRGHLADARAAGLTAAEILEAVLVAVPAVGYPKVMDVMEAIAEYADAPADPS